DLCALGAGGVTCAASLERAPTGDRPTPTAEFAALPAARAQDAGLREPLAFADVDGDGRADVCARGDDGVACARAAEAGSFSPPRTWWRTPAGDFALGDIDGDGKADACQRTGATITCARSDGQAFLGAEAWSRQAPSRYALADVDGDGRADLCGVEGSVISCGTSRRTEFAKLTAWWSSPADDAGIGNDLDPEAIRFADLNGDGRADVCGRTARGVACALSTGRRFTRPTLWARSGGDDAERWDSAPGALLQLADVNGDGRADLCLAAAPPASGVLCGMAP
ncbi:MAG TPA: VCBS repeat-containing protein, partial [Polyangiaceae bacterium]